MLHINIEVEVYLRGIGNGSKVKKLSLLRYFDAFRMHFECVLIGNFTSGNKVKVDALKAR